MKSWILKGQKVNRWIKCDGKVKTYKHERYVKLIMTSLKKNIYIYMKFLSTYCIPVTIDTKNSEQDTDCLSFCGLFNLEWHSDNEATNTSSDDDRW